MALLATNRFAGDGATTSYEFNFVGKYIARPHVKVYQEDNATKVRTPVAIIDSNFLNDTTLRNLPVTPSGKTLVIYRDTPKPPLVDFTNGSRFTEYNMDLVARQGLFVAMEAMDAGDIDAREQLLAAIAGVTALVDDATGAVSDATAAALAAATSASNAAASASAAQAAQSGAETAQTGAQTAAGNSAASALAASSSATAAAGSATTANTRANAANTSATNAATSATNAATSASTASTQATNASNSATAASGSATNAATSATNAANSAAVAQAALVTTVQGRMCCRVVVVNAATRIVRLERCGGQSISINGVDRIIPAAGVTLTVAPNATPQYLYAGWNAGNLVLIENATVPVFDSTLGQWIYPGVPEYVPVAYFRGDGLATPERFLRNYYNAGAPAFVNALASDYTANWDGVDRKLVTAGILLLPGDTVEVVGQASIMSTPNSRVGDLAVKLAGTPLTRARVTHSGEAFLWQSYHCSWAIQRGAGVADPAQEAVFELWYWPISTTGNTWIALTDATRLIIRIIPYKWA